MKILGVLIVASVFGLTQSTSAQQAEDILLNGQADLILLARESLRNSNFPLHAAKHFGDEIDWPLQYLRAK